MACLSKKLYTCPQLVTLILLWLLMGLPVQSTAATEYPAVVIRIGERADTVEYNVAHLLAERLDESGVVNTRIERENLPGEVHPGELLVLLGIPGHHNEISRLFDSIPVLFS